MHDRRQSDGTAVSSGLDQARRNDSTSQGVHTATTPGASVVAGAVNSSTYRIANFGTANGPDAQEINQAPQDPGTGSTTYIGRSHYEGNALVDEQAARAYDSSRQTGLSEAEQKTLELWNAFALPPRAVHESLCEAFTEYCYPWMPILEPDDLAPRDSPGHSSLLTQAVYLAASRVSSSTSVQAFSSPAEFYQRARALFWVGHEKNPLTVIKAITMLHWYTPDGPAFVSYDTSEYWLKIGVGLAYQIGLHKEPTAGPTRAIRRRLWWTLVVRDALISVSRGRPRAVSLEDSDVSPLNHEDFTDAPAVAELSTAYVDICRILGDLVQASSRKRVTAAERSAVEAALFRWSHTLPMDLRLASFSAATQSLEVRPHDFRVRQLHVPYLSCIIILSRSRGPVSGISPAAIFAASFLAGMYEDLLARNLVCKLSPTFTTFGFMSGLVLLSLRQYPALWAIAQTDLRVLHSSLQELSARWKSAIGASKVIGQALSSVPSSDSLEQAPLLRSMTRDEEVLFEGFPLELCRMWYAYENERASQTAPQPDPMIGPPLAARDDQWTNFSFDDVLLDTAMFEGIPDYFWGDWNLNG